jgi:flavin-dependent dehydrogenase
MQSGRDYQIEADVAIIGGGTAGVNTAMAAAELGLKVLVVDKANINRSGARRNCRRHRSFPRIP